MEDAVTDLTDERRAYLERKGWEVFWQNGRFECTNPKHQARYPWLVSRALHMEEFADAAVNEALERAAEAWAGIEHNGCFTGDCPHGTANECVAELSIERDAAVAAIQEGQP